MQAAPSTNGSNGSRDTNGRFAPGNKLGRGNPHARRVARLRTAMLDAVTDDDIRQIVGRLVEQAKDGDVHAAREVLNRCIGKPQDPPNPDRLAIDESALLRELHGAKQALEIVAVHEWGEDDDLDYFVALFAAMQEGNRKALKEYFRLRPQPHIDRVFAMRAARSQLLQDTFGKDDGTDDSEAVDTDGD